MSKAIRLFRNSFKKKQVVHWTMCLASYMVMEDKSLSVEMLEAEFDVKADSIYNYAKTYRLYNALRRRANRICFVASGKCKTDDDKRYVKHIRDLQIKDLRELRKALVYSKWRVVAHAVFLKEADMKKGGKKLTLSDALDALRSGADGGTREFAAYVSGTVITRTKTFKKLRYAIMGAMSFPMTKSDRRILMKALGVAKKRG